MMPAATLPHSALALVLASVLLSTLSLRGALLTVSGETTGDTPVNLAYNLGHFFPGSNTIDWWRYSRSSGARIFLSPSHFNVDGTTRPGETFVGSEASFQKRRAALRHDPLNPDFINWSVIEERFNTALSGNNRIVPEYALRQIHRRGGLINAQMTLGEGSFPIDHEDDWYGKWIAWRTYYSIAFYLAREFDVERFSSHNEPNHPNSFIEPAAWLMRLRLASDAVHSAIEDVNSLYGKFLQPRLKAPVTAGGSGSPFTNYGRPALESIRTNYLGLAPPGHQTFHHYAYQSYNQSPAGFASSLTNLRQTVDSFTPPGVAPLTFAITEYNVHTGATYDSLPESSDTLAKAIRFGAITARLTGAGMDELYAFKFGMTRYTNRFPVQKNGMLFTDNVHAPHHYGTMGRSAEVYRLFNKGFAPGRHLLAHTLSGDGADTLVSLVSHDPESDFYHVFSVNESSQGIPFEIDLSALGLPEGNRAIIEDVSPWRTGVIRSIEELQDGRLTPGSQPGQTVWLISISAAPQRPALDETPLLSLPARQEIVVRDGSQADTNFAGDPLVYARNDPLNANGRAAAFLQFDLPPDWNSDDLLLAILAMPVAPVAGGPDTIHAHLYGIDHHDWSASTLTWNKAPNLLKQVPVGNEIRHRFVAGAGDTAHVLGQITVGGSGTTRQIDVTDYVVRQSDGRASFMMAQDPRWDVDIRVSAVPSSPDDLVRGDTQPDGLRLFASHDPDYSGQTAQLILIRRDVVRLDYESWIDSFFPHETLLQDSFPYPDAPLSGQGEWVRGPSSPASDDPSTHLVVSNGSVLFDWTTSDPVNNLIRRIWPAERTVVDDWIYVSFDLEVVQLPQPEANVRPAFLSLGNSGGSQQRGFVGLRPGPVAGTFQVGISPGSQLGSNFQFAPLNLSPNTPWRIMVGFHAATEETSLWIGSDDPSHAPDLTVAGGGSNGGIRRLNLRLYNSNGANGTTDLGLFRLDNLHVAGPPDSSLIAPTANPSGDGLTNWLKFALGLDPRLPSLDQGPTIAPDELGGWQLQFSRNPAAQGIELIVETSPDLIDWSPQAGTPIIETQPGRDILVLPINGQPPEARRFFRIRAQSTP
jgi:hypothetical protein